MESLLLYRWLQLLLGLLFLRCIQCDCRFPNTQIENGKYLYEAADDAKKVSATEMYVLRFNCNTGYRRIGRKYIQCVDGEWTDNVPVCTKMKCLEPPEVTNGTYEILGGPFKPLTIDTLVTYSCMPGYELSDASASNLICVLDQANDKVVWKGKMPSCHKRKECADPGVSKHGTREGNCCFAGAVLRYSCQEDFELIGQEKIVCQSTGNWSYGRPFCRPKKEDHCELPPDISHGEVVGEKEGDYFLSYEEAEVHCHSGYTYNGSKKFILCEKDGKWEAEFGECTELSCDRPEPLANGTILELDESTLQSFPYNFELSYVCDKGYRLLGGDSWRICRENGWSGKAPHCEEIRCPDPGVPENGDREGNSFEVGAKVRFKCFTGYDLLGSVERYCMPNGQWTGELARCDTSSNYCPNPGTPINGYRNSSRYDLGDIVGFRCHSGYIQVGSEVRECLANRTWSGTETKCLSPYDFDNTAQVGKMLNDKVEERFDEELGEWMRYKEAVAAIKKDGRPLPKGKILDLNFSGRLILYFAFDVSGSVGRHNFQRSIDFAKAIVKKVGVSLAGSRVGALTFSSKANFTFLPQNYNNTMDVLTRLDGIEYTGGGTSATSALQLIRENLGIDERYLGRKRKTAIFLITDGKANMGGSPEVEAKGLKKLGVDIYCIGITGDVRVDLLYKIASNSLYSGVERPNVFILENYPSVFHLIQMITNGSSDYSQCGLGMEKIIIENRGRILGGKQSDQPWPWMAAIFYAEGKNGAKDNRLQRKKNTKQRYREFQLKCGGSIINRNFILTAAHCMYEVNITKQIVHVRLRDKSELLVKLGVTDMENETFAQEFEVERIHLHPKYKYGPSYDYDIALLKLHKPIEYSFYVRPICLPPKDLPERTTFYSSKEFGWVTGWGHEGFVAPDDDHPHLTMSRNLKQIRLSIQSRERCTKSLKEKNYTTSYFTERMFCAGDGRTGNDTCYGDSGGPLMQSQMNSEGYLYWTQVGIVSWGIGCGVKELYGYYTHVHNLLPWIEQKTETVNNSVLDK